MRRPVTPLEGVVLSFKGMRPPSGAGGICRPSVPSAKLALPLPCGARQRPNPDAVNLLRLIQARLLFKGRPPVSTHEENFGVRIGEWPTRAAKAIEMLHAKVPELGEETSLADWGCGRQTLRNFIPKSWKYIPYDYIERTP